MKKKKWLIPVSIIGGILIVLGTALGIFFAKGYQVATGVYIKFYSGKSAWAYDNTVTIMDNKTEHKLFSNLTIGDKILVVHNGIDEGFGSKIHYATTGAYAVFKLQDGTIEDVPQAVLDYYKDGELETEPPSKTAAEETYNVAQYRTRYNDDILKVLYAKALNHQNVSFDEVLYPAGVRHLPIFKFDTLAEFEQFKAEFGDPLASPTYFPDVPVKYEEDFFAENTLMLVYVKGSSGSLKLSVDSVDCVNGKFCIHIKEQEKQSVSTTDIVSWYFIAEVPDSMIENCTEFDADLNYTDRTDSSVDP